MCYGYLMPNKMLLQVLNMQVLSKYENKKVMFLFVWDKRLIYSELGPVNVFTLSERIKLFRILVYYYLLYIPYLKFVYIY